jgi:hypothetical protein
MTGDRTPSVYVVARNPQDDSKLPYLLRLPLEGGSRAAAPAVEPRPKSGFTTPTGQKNPISRPTRRPGHLPAKHRELVTQDQ